MSSLKRERGAEIARDDSLREEVGSLREKLAAAERDRGVLAEQLEDARAGEAAKRDADAASRATDKDVVEAAQTTIARLIDENVDLMDRINQQGDRVWALTDEVTRLRGGGGSGGGAGASPAEPAGGDAVSLPVSVQGIAPSPLVPSSKPKRRSWLEYITGADLV